MRHLAPFAAAIVERDCVFFNERAKADRGHTGAKEHKSTGA